MNRSIFFVDKLLLEQIKINNENLKKIDKVLKIKNKEINQWKLQLGI